MTPVLLTLSAVLTIYAAVPYLVDVARGTTKPRLVSWFVWFIIPLIGAAAALAAHQIPAAIYTFLAALGCGLVVVIGFRYGDRSFERLDIVCLCGAAIGLALWLLLKSPSLAVVASILTDLIGGIPTLKHAWRHPGEENWPSYALYGAGAAITLLVADHHLFSAIAYPLYLGLFDTSVAVVLIVGQRRRRSAPPGAQPAVAGPGMPQIRTPQTRAPARVLPVPQAPVIPGPRLTCTLSAPANAAGWHASPVTVSFAAHDETSPVTAISPPQTVSLDGAGQIIAGSAVNSAGGTSNIHVTINLDQTPPVLGKPLWINNPVAPGTTAVLEIPVLDHLSGVLRGEFIGPNDPGIGHGTPIKAEDGILRVAFATDAGPGTYQVQVRAQDVAGNWSALVRTALVVAAAPGPARAPSTLAS